MFWLNTSTNQARKTYCETLKAGLRMKSDDTLKISSSWAQLQPAGAVGKMSEIWIYENILRNEARFIGWWLTAKKYLQLLTFI